MNTDMSDDRTTDEMVNKPADGAGEPARSEPPELRAYVNERAVSVPYGATALDAVRAADAEDAEAVRAGTRRITDSRGLPIDAETAVHGGAIFRVLAVRATAGGPDASPGTDEALA